MADPSIVNAPAEGEVKPVEGEVKPVEGEVKPAEGEVKPVEGEVKPAVTPEEQKVADEKAAAEKKEAEDKAKGENAPEKYEDFKLPEGIEMDQAALDKFLPLAKEVNLTQEQAQKFIDLRAETVQAESKNQWDVWNKTQDTWVTEAKGDSEIGGANFDENVGLAKKTMEAYGNESLKDLIDVTGAGNHKEFIRFLAKIGKDIGEDKLHISGGNATEQDKAGRIYNHGK